MEEEEEEVEKEEEEEEEEEEEKEEEEGKRVSCLVGFPRVNRFHFLVAENFLSKNVFFPP